MEDCHYVHSNIQNSTLNTYGIQIVLYSENKYMSINKTPITN